MDLLSFNDGKIQILQTGECIEYESETLAKISSWSYDSPEKDENSLADAVATYEPLSIAIFVNGQLDFLQVNIFKIPTIFH